MRVAPEEFGASLRHFRERAGLTQEQLAERAGLSANAVSSLERGARRRPYPHTRDALATALGITAAERAGWDDQVPAAGPRLPIPPSAILGREADLTGVVTLLADARIVTLVGPGGVGKSRLALAVAEQFPGGAAFVALAALQDAADVLPAIAHALGLRELGPREVAAVLAAHLRTRRLLLVLDNLEHLLDAAPDIAALVAATGGVRVLVTSRAPLRIRGEHVHAVAALAPDVAGELFVERAAQAGATVAEPGPIAQLCARLDHLPLAIELAAAQTRLLTPSQLLSRLDTVLLGVASGARDAPAHQQTLRATVGWSYDLLTLAEQALLRHVALFAGGWTLRAAAELSRMSEADTLDGHRALLDNSLIARDPTAVEPRFTILETVRAFALHELSRHDERGPGLDRHATMFAALAAAAEPRLLGPDAADALDELEADHDNIRAALRHLLDSGHIDELAAACSGSSLFWVVRGHLRDPHALALAGLAAAPDREAGTRARLHTVAGSTALPRGANDEAVEHFAAAAHLAPDAEGRGWALIWGALAEIYRGRPAAAAAKLDAAGDPTGHAASGAVIGRAHVAIAAGAMTDADALLTAQLPVIEARGAAWLLGVALGVHGRVAAVLGAAERADALLTRSVAVLGELGDTWGMVHQLTHLADVAAQRGDHDRAASLYGAIDALSEQVGTRVFASWQELSDRWQAATLTALGVERFTARHRAGRALSPAEVVELAATPQR
ncbi:ATP-binding protein [Pseudonocardia sp. GCM10023141]|uniref:ATP-binding protein n=1 Tax=Pseudonocardia sp. GCM10023141 TaxID=3252653 RepID=UPI00361C1254